MNMPDRRPTPISRLALAVGVVVSLASAPAGTLEATGGPMLQDDGADRPGSAQVSCLKSFAWSPAGCGTTRTLLSSVPSMLPQGWTRPTSPATTTLLDRDRPEWDRHATTRRPAAWSDRSASSPAGSRPAPAARQASASGPVSRPADAPHVAAAVVPALPPSGAAIEMAPAATSAATPWNSIPWDRHIASLLWPEWDRHAPADPSSASLRGPEWDRHAPADPSSASLRDDRIRSIGRPIALLPEEQANPRSGRAPRESEDWSLVAFALPGSDPGPAPRRPSIRWDRHPEEPLGTQGGTQRDRHAPGLTEYQGNGHMDQWDRHAPELVAAAPVRLLTRQLSELASMARSAALRTPERTGASSPAPAPALASASAVRSVASFTAALSASDRVVAALDHLRCRAEQAIRPVGRQVAALLQRSSRRVAALLPSPRAGERIVTDPFAFRLAGDAWIAIENPIDRLLARTVDDNATPVRRVVYSRAASSHRDLVGLEDVLGFADVLALPLDFASVPILFGSFADDAVSASRLAARDAFDFAALPFDAAPTLATGTRRIALPAAPSWWPRGAADSTSITATALAPAPARRLDLDRAIGPIAITFFIGLLLVPMGCSLLPRVLERDERPGAPRARAGPAADHGAPGPLAAAAIRRPPGTAPGRLRTA